MARIRRIRSRDYLLVDTLDQQYESAYREMLGPYTDWREARLREVNIIREVESEANQRVATGIAIAAIGILAGAAINSSSVNTSVGNAGGGVAAVGVVLGSQRILSAEGIRKQASINLEALTESGESFSSEVEPFVTEVEGETVRLVGTAEAKYAQWRDVLKRIHERDFGDLPKAPAKAT